MGDYNIGYIKRWMQRHLTTDDKNEIRCLMIFL